MQQHNRARVLAAARAEFIERGFRDTKIDAITERADLTRGEVYSNFPSKRALYFVVLARTSPKPLPRPPGGSARRRGLAAPGKPSGHWPGPGSTAYPSPPPTTPARAGSAST